MMFKLRTTALAALFAVATVLPSVAQERREVPEFRTYGEAASPADTAAIDALMAGYRDAWSRRDVDALMALHAADTEWINSYARMFQGSAPLADFLEHRMFPAFDPAVATSEAENMKLISIRYVGDDAAVLHAYSDSPRGESEGEQARRVHMHVVLEKQEDGWKVVHTAIMDAR